VSMEESQGTATLYWCDPEKNVECAKRNCRHVLTREEGGICEATFRRAYAMTDGNGVPMVYEKAERFKRARTAQEQKRRDF